MPSSPFLDAERLNKRIEFAQNYYVEHFVQRLKEATEMGIVGRARASGQEEEFAAISMRVPLLQQVVMDMERHPGQRLRAQRELQRWYKLRGQLE